MSKFTKWQLTREIFRILPGVISKFLWNLLFLGLPCDWNIVFGVITETNYVYSPGRRAAKKPYFSPIPLLLTGFRLISIQQWLKTSFARKKGILSDQPEKKLYCFSRMRKSQNLDFCFFCESISIFLSRFFSPFFSFFIDGFVAHFIVFALHGIVAG